MPRLLTILLIVDNEPEREDDIYALPGQVVAEASGEVWRGQEGRWIPLDPDWESRARPITEDLRDLLGPAGQFLPVVVRPLPEGDTDGVPLGWRLPEA